MNLNDHTRDTTVTVNLPTAREPDVSEEMKTRFQEVCQEYGIPKENILDLTEVDEMEKIEENGNFRIFLEYIQALDSSSMLIKTSVRENGQCSEISVIADETSQDDTYSILYDGYNRLRIIEAVYDEYVLFHNVNFNKGKEFQVMFLHGRTPDLSPEIKTWFGEVCQTYGIPNENILDLTKVDRCLQTRGSY
ncbi:allergen Fel d 4-like [Hipposideros larvatus]